MLTLLAGSVISKGLQNGYQIGFCIYILSACIVILTGYDEAVERLREQPSRHVH